MKTLDAALSNALSAENSIICFLLDFTVAGTTYYYTDANVDLFYNGNTYTSYGMNPEAIGISVNDGQDGVTIQVDNSALEMASIVLNNDALGGAVNLYLATVANIGPELITNGNMESDSEWSAYNSPSTCEQSSERAHGGSYSWKFIASSIADGVKSTTTFATIGGQSYEISFWVVPVDTTEVGTQLRYGDNSGWISNVETGLTQNVWNKISITASMPAGNGGSGSYVTVYENTNPYTGTYYIDDFSVKEITAKKIQAVENMFSGMISHWRMTNNVLYLETVNHLVWWNKRTLRQTTGDCRWDFKGTECGYGGGTTSCDRTYANCLTLSNSDNFGGFRFLPSVQELDIWWGRAFSNKIK
jgi:phage-related protein